jgi:hypothetical protein
MKHYFLFRLLFILIFLVCCQENISLKKQDIHKYPWLKPFLLDITSNFKGTHDIDRGILQFNYKYDQLNKDVFSTFDSIAKWHQWNCTEVNQFNRQYAKHLNQFKADTSVTVINIKLDTLNGKLFYNIQ